MIDWLFATDVFMLRSNCGPGWSRELVLATQLGDIGMGVAYLVIPLLIGFYLTCVGRRSPFYRILCWSVGFVVLCGAAHWCEVLAFHWPAYRLFAFIKLAGTAVSLASMVIAIIDMRIAARYVLKLKGASGDDGMLLVLRDMIREYRSAAEKTRG